MSADKTSDRTGLYSRDWPRGVRDRLGGGGSRGRVTRGGGVGGGGGRASGGAPPRESWAALRCMMCMNTLYLLCETAVTNN